ncbi:MAG: PhoPQ-activated pathogenicity-related family protein [Fimbriimonadaceae bacterium]|jgi:PhoPQ-activated pathogenicity-related protein|nr:PhoPQ-activated pathogenicity-related family protein [Fimbriimonadaceae bacterium]
MDGPSHLVEYCAKSHDVRWRRSRKDTIHLQSQVWQGLPWQHRIFTIGDPGPAAILEITGEDLGQTEEDFARDLATTAGLPIITLTQVPNQPWNNLWEDDFIASTFQRFLETGDPDWPLLFPMVQSVKAAIQAISAVWGVEKIILTGASKRGWTSYLAAALGLPEVIGAAPRVFDCLDLPWQMQRQRDLWGDYSEMLDPYTQLGLRQLLDQEQGIALAREIDPIHFLPKVPFPLYPIVGTNDSFWAPDSLSRYRDQLPPGSQALSIPNSGHNLGPGPLWKESLGAYARFRIADHSLPSFSDVSSAFTENWQAVSETPAFSLAVFEQAPLTGRFKLCLELVHFQTEFGPIAFSSNPALSGPYW